jgi:hypothetical protein
MAVAVNFVNLVGRFGEVLRVPDPNWPRKLGHVHVIDVYIVIIYTDSGASAPVIERFLKNC